MKAYKDIAGDGGSGIVEQVTDKLAHLKQRMSGIKHKIAILSGKGGVGKSTITLRLAADMARQGFKVGILDADLNGPSIPKMIGIEGSAMETYDTGILPPSGPLDIKVMSMELFLSSKDKPITWQGPTSTSTWISAMEATAVRELLADTEWGTLDYLFIDMPPVLSRFNDLAGLLPDLSGVIIVTIPSEVSHLIMLKSITRVKDLNIPLIGVIENMKGYTCEHCGKQNNLFTEENMEEVFSYIKTPYLGRVPFDRTLSTLTNKGLAGYLRQDSKLPLTDVFNAIGKKVRAAVGEDKKIGS